MLPKDKYTLFDKKEKSYRKSIHSMSSSHFYFHILPNWFIAVWIGWANHFLYPQSCPSGLVSANVSTLPVSKRIFIPRTCTIHPKLDSGGGLVGAKNNIWTTGVLAFWNLQRGRSEEDGGLQCSMITPALRSGFQFKCILARISICVRFRYPRGILMI